MTDEARLAAASVILLEHGLSGGRLTAEGPQREIATLSVPAAEWNRLLEKECAAIATDIRALGYRYVALDLVPLDP